MISVKSYFGSGLEYNWYHIIWSLTVINTVDLTVEINTVDLTLETKLTFKLIFHFNNLIQDLLSIWFDCVDIELKLEKMNLKVDIVTRLLTATGPIEYTPHGTIWQCTSKKSILAFTKVMGWNWHKEWIPGDLKIPSAVLKCLFPVHFR